ncbi:fatty acid desaturase [Aliiroseovarius subalbicans]|uniref:fatty acid desaturase n=1 Tax=Aliiroseovarius subalbicans TaxID=2925840 RepID=UPI001F587940|nr:fatty acid desaturase [Aliiroseovarius subalbicans]MCI2398058.1 fatty acid desaturase [Aliiroseovarius subalbicans]
MAERGLRDEVPILAVLVLIYGLYAFATIWVATWSVGLAILLAGFAAALHSSACHEVLHGHPVRAPWINGALVFPALSLCIPYLRFRDTHLAHHCDDRLTDPYDDPESNFVDPKLWAGLPRSVRALLRVNNTLAGRMLLGPAIGQVAFMWTDARAIWRGETRVLAGWVLHLPAVLVVVWWAVSVGHMPGWGYLAAAYLALSLLKIRTFLEHRAHECAPGRTVVIEDRGILAFLFLNNNFHIVHHSHPGAPWWRLRELYDTDRAGYLRLNHGYVYPTYRAVFRRHFLQAKDPVPHPLWPDRG